MPPHDLGLLARLDALVELAADRHGLALLPGGRLAAAESQVAARAAGVSSARGSTTRGSAMAQRDAVELLRAVAEGVGLLRVRGDRLEATSLRHAWAQIDEACGPASSTPPGATACPGPCSSTAAPGSRSSSADASGSSRLLLGLPAGVEVGLQGLVETVASGLELDLDDWLPRAIAAAFLDPLVALGVADIRPPPPHPGASLRLGPAPQP